MLLATAALAGCTQNHTSFLDPQGPIAAAQRNHYWFIVAMVLIVVLPVILLTPLLVWRYRYGGKAVYRPRWAFSWPLDLMMWGVPVVIVGILSYVLWQETSSLDPYKPLPSDKQPLRVQVVGFDWKWLFIYPDQGIATVGKLVFPANRPVSFELTSATVLQTFFIPALGGQIDAMNRMVTRLHLKADSPGSFRGKNMQYNGDGFYKQRFTAQAVTADAFTDFVNNVRRQGQPLGREQYAVLARRGSSSDVAKALGVDNTRPDGMIRFSRVPKDFFNDIVGSRLGWAAPTTKPPGISKSLLPAAIGGSAKAPPVPWQTDSRHKEKTSGNEEKAQ